VAGFTHSVIVVEILANIVSGDAETLLKIRCKQLGTVAAGAMGEVVDIDPVPMSPIYRIKRPPEFACRHEDVGIGMPPSIRSAGGSGSPATTLIEMHLLRDRHLDFRLSA